MKAIENPGKFLSVIIDGADQSKFGIPRFLEKCKSEAGYSLKQKLTGVLSTVDLHHQSSLRTSPLQRIFLEVPIRQLNHSAGAFSSSWNIEHSSIICRSPIHCSFNLTIPSKIIRIDISWRFVTGWFIREYSNYRGDLFACWTHT